MDTDCQLPHRYEIAEMQKLEDGLMYHQDFKRLYATILNNISTVHFKLNDVKESDYWNDMSISEDPDYGKATYRKCCILQKMGDYKRAAELCRHAIDQYTDENEMDEMNKKTVPAFQSLLKQLEGQVPRQEEDYKERLQKEVDEVVDKMFPKVEGYDFFEDQGGLSSSDDEEEDAESKSKDDADKENKSNEEKPSTTFVTAPADDFVKKARAERLA